jgi:hypothetical protein
MSQPVKLSDALVLEARIAGEAQERSIAGQVEFWAKLGRSLEDLLGARELRILRAGAAHPSLTELIESIDKPEGRARLKAYLASEPYPHFEPHPTRKGLLVRIEADGRRTTGRFVNRKFVESSNDKPAAIKARVRRGVAPKLAKAARA